MKDKMKLSHIYERDVLGVLSEAQESDSGEMYPTLKAIVDAIADAGGQFLTPIQLLIGTHEWFLQFHPNNRVGEPGR